MNVFQLRTRLVSDYADYVRSFIHIRDDRIRAVVDRELDEGLLWPDPLIQLNPSFASGGWIDDLVAEGVLHEECRRVFRLGRGLSLEAQYTDWLSGLATTRCRFILSDLVADKAYATKAAEGNFSFMRTNAAYKRSMELAYRRWRWVEKRLNR